MHIKTFMLGAITGAVAYGVADLALRDRMPEQSAAPVTNETAAQTFQEPSVADQVTEVPQAQQPLVEQSPQASTNDENERDGSQSADAARRPTERPNAEEMTSIWMAREYSKLLEEPKDDSWAHYAEQAVLQFLTRHRSMSEFEISYIECRTSFCQVRVYGVDDSSWPTWQRVTYEMGKEPWYDFVGHGSSTSTVNGRFVIIENLRRTAKESEN